MPKLLIKSGEQKGAVCPLSDARLTIGRDPASGFVLSDRRVSWNHAVIFLQGEEYVIEDLGSVNGVYVNQALVTKHTLREGDEVKLGATVILFSSKNVTEQHPTDQPGTSRVQIIPEAQTPQGLTVEMRIPTTDPRSMGVEIARADLPMMQKAYERLTTLYRISHELATVIELPKLLEKILELSLETMQADRGFIMLADDKSGAWQTPTARYREGVARDDLSVSQTIIKQVMATGEAILTSDALSDQRFKEAQSIIIHGIRSSMCVPIKRNQKILGIMQVDTKGKEICFAKPDLELLTAMATQAAVAIENAKLFDDLKGANREIQERQTQLIEAEKLSALGRLAGGVAHEINNPMTCILGYSGMVRAKLVKGTMTPEEIKECADSMKIVEDEAQHCARIAQSLLQFGRRKKAQMALTDVNAVIQETLMVAKFHIKKVSIEIKTELFPQLPQIMANASQLQQVFLNFIINARDAMEKTGGRLVVSTAKSGDRQIDIKFADTGCGIPVDKLEEIFKPLYTTKEEGKGTGLGLSISQEIVELHRGTIEVESTLGQGTVFTVRLPIGR